MGKKKLKAELDALRALVRYTAGMNPADAQRMEALYTRCQVAEATATVMRKQIEELLIKLNAKTKEVDALRETLEEHGITVCDENDFQASELQ